MIITTSYQMYQHRVFLTCFITNELWSTLTTVFMQKNYVRAQFLLVRSSNLLQPEVYIILYTHHGNKTASRIAQKGKMLYTNSTPSQYSSHKPFTFTPRDGHTTTPLFVISRQFGKGGECHCYARGLCQRFMTNKASSCP